MKAGDGDAVAADLIVGTADFIVDDAGVVDQKISRADVVLFVVDQIITLSAADQQNLDEILVRVHHARMSARGGKNLADIQQLRNIIAGEQRGIKFFYKTLNI